MSSKNAQTIELPAFLTRDPHPGFKVHRTRHEVQAAELAKLARWRELESRRKRK